MRAIKHFLTAVLTFALFMSPKLFGQETEATPEQPQRFITMTTVHWNPTPGTDFSDWLKTEKEYFDKVTKKNDYIKGSAVLTHYFTGDNSEIKLVTMYDSWDDIEKAEAENQKLLKAGWPDEAERNAFLQKQRNYYSPRHSDEIYTALPFYKDMAEFPKEPVIVYLKTNDLSFSPDGKVENFKEYNEKVIKKNPLIKAYYTQRHAWGSNGTEMLEVFIFDHFGDIEKSFEENQKLAEAAWPDEAQRTEFMDGMGKLFTGQHGDYIYHNVPELQK